MKRVSLIVCAFAAVAAFSAPQSKDTHRKEPAGAKLVPLPPEDATWIPAARVLFKGKIIGMHTSTAHADGKSYFSLLVKTKDNGTAMVELGPEEYVKHQGLNIRMGAEIWVSGSKTWIGQDSIILAQRVNLDGLRPSFRTDDGKPFWELMKG